MPQFIPVAAAAVAGVDQSGSDLSEVGSILSKRVAQINRNHPGDIQCPKCSIACERRLKREKQNIPVIPGEIKLIDGTYNNAWEAIFGKMSRTLD